MLSGVRTSSVRSTRPGSTRPPANSWRVDASRFCCASFADVAEPRLAAAAIERRGIASLTTEEIVELGRLYRAMTSDLAYAQGRGYDARCSIILNRSVARAHAHIYAASPQSGLRRIADFYTTVFPARVSAVAAIFCDLHGDHGGVRGRRRTFSFAIIRPMHTRFCPVSWCRSRFARVCTIRTLRPIRTSPRRCRR